MQKTKIEFACILHWMNVTEKLSHQILLSSFWLLTYTIRTTLSLSQNRSVTGHWWTRLRVAADFTVHANATNTNIGFPGLSSQENITFIIFTVTGYTLIAWWGRLNRSIYKYKYTVKKTFSIEKSEPHVLQNNWKL